MLQKYEFGVLTLSESNHVRIPSFLTNYDLSSIKTDAQLCSMVKIRSGISEEQAKRDVVAWMEGKQF